MPLLRINAQGREIALHAGAGNLRAALKDSLSTSGPITIMVHGYRFQPDHPLHCPHKHIFSTAPAHPCTKAISWPRELGLCRGNPREGLAIAFGWNARGSLKSARDRSHEAAFGLAALIMIIQTLAPARQVNMVAHSLGAHPVLQVLRLLTAHSVARVILMNAATYQSHARDCLNSIAGRTCEVISASSRENALYDRLFSWALPTAVTGDKTLAHGIANKNILSMRIDDFFVRQALAKLGHPIAPKTHPCCHWSTYLRPSLFPFYKALIHEPEKLSLVRLRKLLACDIVETRNVQLKRHRWLLPLGSGQAS